MTTGERIKNARKAAGLTQKELGEKLGLSYQAVAQWENNLRKPKAETLRKIANALDVFIWELVPSEVPEEFMYGYYSGIEEGKIYADLEERRFSETNWRLKAAMDKLNTEGQQKAVERVEELTEIPKYQKAEKPIDPPLE